MNYWNDAGQIRLNLKMSSLKLIQKIYTLNELKVVKHDN